MMNPVETLNAGCIAVRRGDMAGALAWFRSFLAHNPSDAETWLNVADAELCLEHLDAAGEALEHATALKDNFRYLYLNSKILFKNKKYQESLAILDLLASREDKNMPAVVELRSLVKTALNDPAGALIDSVRNAILRHGFIWRSNLGRLLSGACRPMLNHLGLLPEINLKIEDNLLHEHHARCAPYFRERGTVRLHSDSMNIGFVGAFAPEQVSFLAHFLPLLKTRMPQARFFAYGTHSIENGDAPSELASLLEWRGMAGKLTYAGSQTIALDALDVLCDLEWGDAEARTDFAMLNPAPARLLWMIANGRCRVSITDIFHIDQDRATTAHEWHSLAALAISGVKGWKDNAALPAVAQDFDHLMAVILQETHKRSMYPRQSAGGAPPPMMQIDAKRASIATQDVHKRTNNFFANWLKDVQRLNFHFSLDGRAQNLRIAVLTPYVAGQTKELEFSRQSLVEQTEQKIPCQHFVIGQGVCDPIVDQWNVEHIVMPHNPDDLGLTALSLGAQAALAQGYNAIAFLPAGIRWRGSHLRELALACIRRGSDLTMSRAALIGTHGRVFAEHVNVGVIPVYHDTVLATFMVTGRALNFMSLWAAVPRPARYYATGLFRSVMRAHGIRQYMIPNATIEAKAVDLFSFKRFSGFTPEQAMPLAFKERALMEESGDWKEWLALLSMTNAAMPAPEKRVGVLYDAVATLTSKHEQSCSTEMELWAKSLPVSAGFLPLESEALDQWLLQLGQDKVTTLTFAAHNSKQGIMMTSRGAIYPLDGIVAALASKRISVKSWQASHATELACLYTLDLCHSHANAQTEMIAA